MRKVLLATAAVAVIGLSATGANADYWTTANVNYGSVSGSIKADDLKAYRKGSISVGNMGALTVNDNEENTNVKIKGPIVHIEVDQDVDLDNKQLTLNSQDVDNRVGAKSGAKAGAAAGAGALAVAKNGDSEAYFGKADNDADADALAIAGAKAGARSSAYAGMDDVNVHQSNDNENYQKGANFAAIYVEDQLGGLLSCGCSSDDFYTLNINKGHVSGSIYADDLYAGHSGSISVGNVGAATINKSVNNLDVHAGGRTLRR